MLDSSGWLHKIIRAESVIFSPEHATAPLEDRYEIKLEIDFAKLNLMRYIVSRLDDVSIRMQPPSEPQREETRSIREQRT